MGAARTSTTPLPGIGVRYDLTTRQRRRPSVVARRDGPRTLSAYRGDDPDACALSVRLTRGEAEALAEALKPTHHSPNLLSIHHRTGSGGRAGPAVRHVALERAAARRHPDVHRDTGVSIVAVLRPAEAIPSPGFRLAGGDTLIMIGTREGVDAAAAILGRERGGCTPPRSS
ncbi:potassium/proton antiporter regulatory subunit (CPA2 family) [Streptomyces sp. BK340]|nr:potassium/proton antiporter regulatory subunit (CPA2 family) [Streptomyces sp. BK340]